MTRLSGMTFEELRRNIIVNWSKQYHKIRPDIEQVILELLDTEGKCPNLVGLPRDRKFRLMKKSFAIHKEIADHLYQRTFDLEALGDIRHQLNNIQKMIANHPPAPPLPKWNPKKKVRFEEGPPPLIIEPRIRNEPQPPVFNHGVIIPDELEPFNNLPKPGKTGKVKFI